MRGVIFWCHLLMIRELTGGLLSVFNYLRLTVFPRDKCADKRGARDEACETDGLVVVCGFGLAPNLDGEPAQVSGGGLRFAGRSAVGLRRMVSLRPLLVCLVRTLR